MFVSIIICSKDTVSLETVLNNIAETIGCKYEIIVIDNSNNQFNIFQAYNEGVRRSKGELLCFVHEDVFFHSKSWGGTIKQHFTDNDQIGLIGFAGSHFLADSPMYWYSSPFVSQHNLNNDQGKVEKHFHEEWFKGENIVEVAAVDGFCFFVRKILFDQITFDEKIYKGFHLYDMDLCMQVIKSGYKVCVIRDVLTEHCWSESKQFTKQGGELFDHNLELFSKKWNSCLPINKGLDLPREVFSRVNELFRQVYSAHQIRQSKAYRLGKKILSPLKWLKQ